MDFDLPSLKADCSQCAALCCVAFAFDKSDKFAMDKPAGVACPHLDGAHRCQIHDALAKNGFSGCVQYDCGGAGQAVTQEVFGGASWQDDPKLLAPMMEAFFVMRRVHECLELLSSAAALPLNQLQARNREALMARLLAENGWTRETVDEVARSSVFADVDAFLAGLREVASGARARGD